MLIDRYKELALSKKRELLAPNAEFLVYHWSGECEAFAPATGEMAPPREQVISFGDHNCRVDTGKPFPYADQMPSKAGKFEYSELNWAEDFAFFLDHSPVVIHESELIVSEMNWQLEEARLYKYPEECQRLGFEARKLGAGGFSLAHNLPGPLHRHHAGLDRHPGEDPQKTARSSNLRNRKSAEYLKASELVVEAILRYIRRHADEALRRSGGEADPAQRALYTRIARNCRALAEGAPQTFEQGVQWVQFYIVTERMTATATGTAASTSSFTTCTGGMRTPAGWPGRGAQPDRGALSEVRRALLRLRRQEAGPDRRHHELSWVAPGGLRPAGGYNHLGVMWHSDIDPAFFR